MLVLGRSARSQAHHGYRWVVTYNLALDVDIPNMPTAAMPTSRLQIQHGGPRLLAAMQEWLRVMKNHVEIRTQEKIDLAKKSADCKEMAVMLKQLTKEWELEDYRGRLTSAIHFLRDYAETEKEKARKNDEKLKELDKVMPSIIYCFEQTYSAADLRLGALQGRDKVQARALRDVAAHLPVDVYLAILEKKDYGVCEKSFSKYRGRHRWQYANQAERDDVRRGTGENVFHDLDWVIDSGCAITKLADLDGTHIATNLQFDTNDAAHMQGDIFEFEGEQVALSIDSLANGGGAKATHIFQNAGLVIVPRDDSDQLVRAALASFFEPMYNPVPEQNMQSLVAYFAKGCVNPANDRDQACLQKLKFVCDYALDKGGEEQSHKYKLDEKTSTILLQALMRMGEQEYFDEMVANLQGRLDTTRFFKWLTKITDIQGADQDSNSGNGSNAGNKMAFAVVQESILKVLLSKPTMNEFSLGLRILAPKPESPWDYRPTATTNPPIEKWVRAAIETRLDTLEDPALDFLEGFRLVELCNDYYGLDYVKAIVVPKLKNRARHVSFLMGCLEYTYGQVEAAVLGPEMDKLSSIYKALAQSLVKDADFSAVVSVDCLNVAKRTLRGDIVTSSQVRPDPVVFKKLQKQGLEPCAPNWLVYTYEHLMHGLANINSGDASWNELATDLSTKIITDIHKLGPGDRKSAIARKQEALCKVWLPMLQDLYEVFDDRRLALRPSSSPAPSIEDDSDEEELRGDILENDAPATLLPEPHRRIFVAILDAYLDYCVGVPPQEPEGQVTKLTGWLPGGCCLDCDAVNAFIDKEDVAELELTINQKRRDHVEQQLRQYRVRVQTQTEMLVVPHILIITKGVPRFRMAYQAWEKRRQEAQRELNLGFREETLQGYLGADNFARITSMQRLLDPANWPGPQAKYAGKTRRYMTEADKRDLLAVVLPTTPAPSAAFVAAAAATAAAAAGSTEIVAGPSTSPGRGTKRKADNDGEKRGPSKRVDM